MNRSPERVSDLLYNYLRNKNILPSQPKWEIKKSNLGGLGVFAKEDIPAGDIIFYDMPIVIGPRTTLNKPICVVCYKGNNLQYCSCHLPVCSNECENSITHQKECLLIRKWMINSSKEKEQYVDLYKYITPARVLCLNEDELNLVETLKSHFGDQHGFEVNMLSKKFELDFSEKEKNYMLMCCRVMDANAYEIDTANDTYNCGVRGLYPLGSLCNHDCRPNIFHNFDKNHCMVVKASVLIKKGEEILNSYTRIMWGTLNRRLILARTKHFKCSCTRCADPTEFGSYINALKCSNCKCGNVLPTDSLDLKSNWKCDLCQKEMGCVEIGRVLSLIGSILGSFSDDDIEIMIKFLKTKLPLLVHDNHQSVLEIKCKIVFCLGHKHGSIKDIAEDMLILKENYCLDILKVIDKLQLGYFKLRAFILYELYLTLTEKMRRRSNGITATDLKNVLNEVLITLKNDVSAPREILELEV